ncbi:hypothetical protein KIN20_036110 [Parelaphostrongylus tenuis]|uniref:Uncharacterized protein n=1 Tax=Parelaphostrongylus tenuis TaxID=148309 RepID=A0AAD5RC38_PARTN|nr:hypothetical protein KIN20_036110 [Parelaphostrongylus tenuis]
MILDYGNRDVVQFPLSMRRVGARRPFRLPPPRQAVPVGDRLQKKNTFTLLKWYRLLYTAHLHRIGLILFMSEELSSLMIVDEDDLLKSAVSVSIIVSTEALPLEQNDENLGESKGKCAVVNGESSVKKALEEPESQRGKSADVKEKSVDVAEELGDIDGTEFLQESSDLEKSVLEDEIDDDDVVVVDECGDGDESGTLESEEQLLNRQRNYKRKVVRIPKEVFDSWQKNEIARKSSHVDANLWDTTDEVSVLDIGVPPTAKLNPTLIVDNFDNDPVHREAQEARLKSILEHRESCNNAVSKKPRPQTRHTSVSKILSVELQRKWRRITKKSRWSLQSCAISPKRRGLSTFDSGRGRMQRRNFPVKTFPMSPRSGFPRREERGRRQANYRPYSELLTASNANRNGTERGFAPSYHQNDGRNRQQRFRPTRRTEEQMSYGGIHPFNNRRESIEMSPWSRPPVMSSELRQLEEVMRRAAQNNASSMDAARQVDKFGLNSALGTVLNAVNHTDLPLTTRSHMFSDSPSLPARSLAPLIDKSVDRIHKDLYGTSQPNRRDFNSRAINDVESNPGRTRDVSSFAEPHGRYGESGSKFSHAGCISYPLMASPSDVHGNETVSTFGQSYSAFGNNQTYGQRTQFGRVRGSQRHRSPYSGRRY